VSPLPSTELDKNLDLAIKSPDADGAGLSTSSLRYDYSLDSFDENSHYGRLLQRVGHNKRVLELGCSTGYLTSAMTDQFGCTVTGVEVDTEAADAARLKGHEVLVLDLDKIDLSKTFNGRKFDVVLCADVLEHLRAPEVTLRQLNSLLDEGGYVICSIPHVGHADIRLSLLNGRLPYRPMGLLDHTHMKFFTRALVEELFESADFCIESVERNRWQMTKTEVQGHLPSSLPELANFIAFDPESETYQFIVKARPYVCGERSIDDPADSQAGQAFLSKEKLARVDLLIIDQGPQTADDIYQKHLSTINYPSELIRFWFASSGGGLSLADKPKGEATPYGESDFRTFRFTGMGSRDELMARPSLIAPVDKKSVDPGINIASTLRSVAQGSDAKYVFVLQANALAGSNCLRRLVSLAQSSNQNPLPLVVARPEIRLADEPQPVGVDNHIAWHDFSGMLIPRDFLLELKSLDPNLWTVRAQAVDMCFRAWACGRAVIECPEANYYSNGPLGSVGDYDDTVADGLRLRRRWGSSRNILAFAKYCALSYGGGRPMTWLKTASHVIAALAIETPLRSALSPEAASFVAFGGPGASEISLGR